MEVDSDEWRSSADMDISTQLYTGRLQLQKATTESKKLFSYFFLIIVILFIVSFYRYVDCCKQLPYPLSCL